MNRLGNLGLALILAGFVGYGIAAVLVPAVTGTTYVTIDRSSMQRVLPLGSVAYIAPQSGYGVGDIVTFTQNGNVVTHAIHDLLPNPANNVKDGLWLRTKGTENAEPDPLPIERSQIIGKVVYSLPVMGTVIRTVTTPVVIAFITILAVGFYLLAGPKGTKPMDDTVRADSLPENAEQKPEDIKTEGLTEARAEAKDETSEARAEMPEAKGWDESTAVAHG